MITVLADHNIEGQAQLLWGTLSSADWLELVPMRLVRFDDVGLPFDSSDRDVWRFVQAHSMLLLTDNRNMAGDDSTAAESSQSPNPPAARPFCSR